ncbi:septum formation initiator family protein [Candidatus Haliotispira prima]|uniref:Septum formation initiator family protein n=1 Tax=Candidatus Haliotispira prima TaxID=3034016 RepID=A0ABY8MIU4_9SPIO|nr:septum formation initiator family protein [Candidatus Haliotispira prima]
MFKIGNLLEQICLLACLYVVSYQLIMFVWGNHGLVAHRKLLQVQQQMELHYEQLEKHQRDLLVIADRSSSDRSYITMKARGLGYYQKNDKLILVNTWSRSQPAPSPGDQLTPNLQATQSRQPGGIWFYSLFLASCFWLVIRLLHFGRTDIMPGRFGWSDREKFPKVPRMYHSKAGGRKTVTGSLHPDSDFSAGGLHRDGLRPDGLRPDAARYQTQKTPHNGSKNGTLGLQQGTGAPVSGLYFPGKPGGQSANNLHRN